MRLFEIDNKFITIYKGPSKFIRPDGSLATVLTVWIVSTAERNFDTPIAKDVFLGKKQLDNLVNRLHKSNLEIPQCLKKGKLF